MINKLIKEKRIYFDGGTGTMLQAMGLKPGEAPESWNLTNPDKIIALHKAYLEAGCNIIKTNTMGATKEKFSNWREMLIAGLDCAKKAVNGQKEKFIAFDMGPTGRLLAPLGDLSFEDAVSIYADNVKTAAENGADLILIETMNDSYETKAAVIAAKENCSLPIFVTNVYDETCHLMTGADPLAMIAMLEALGVDALGINCSLGPDKMLPVVKKLTDYASVPVIVNPNAGLPDVIDGKTVYNIDKNEFSDYMVKIAEAGASVLGGCCGTTPEFISATIEKTKDIPLKKIRKKNHTIISSYTHSVFIGEDPILIGERINPTGKPKFKEALRQGNINYIVNEGIRQADAGVQVLDVNVGLPEINETEMMCDVVKLLQSVCDLPLQLDSSNSEVLEKAMRIYNGKPLINSVNGNDEVMNSVFPLVKKYGGTVIALTLDKNGIPDTAAGRIDIARRIISRAEEFGISKDDIIVDPLAMTISSDRTGALTTLECVRRLKELGIKTSLGVSNISFGLPRRDLINSTFFANALENGLNCAIMNPFTEGMMNTYFSFRALHGLDKSCLDYIAFADTATKETKVSSSDVQSDEEALISAVVKGVKPSAIEMSTRLLEKYEPLEIINNQVIPALNQIGIAFEEKKAYLPQLLMSAEAATAAFDVIKEKIPSSAEKSNKRIILATVKGDIHDIGKNIVKVMMESYGFVVIDLGRDVDEQVIVDTAVKTGCKLVGLSALMTTTVPSMEKTIDLLHKTDKSITVIVGGAVLNEEYAKMIRADKYCKDAMDSVRFAEDFYKK